jgi:hypothetical protein
MSKKVIITKKSKTILLELPKEHYESLCFECKSIIEQASKKNTLQKIFNTLPVMSLLMTSSEILKDLNTGDKIHI